MATTVAGAALMVVGLSACSSTSATETQVDYPGTGTTTTYSSSRVVVPNGVGMNYQSAQDMWRRAGLVVVQGYDVTGLNRLAVIDSNWMVLGQSIRPGTTVNQGTAIRASIRKYTD